jgi:TonB-dependent SusC/RagA subfamily outer membrane receptor
MENFLIYIGKAAIGAGAFYLAFLVLFQNQKHFGFNRIYLPVSMALSFIIPLITFTTVQYIEPTSFDINSFAYPGNTTTNAAVPGFVPEWYHYLFGLYVAGISGFLFHLVLGHCNAFQIIRKSRVKKLFEIAVNITKKDVHPFSFFSKIVLSEKTLASRNLEMIVCHENIHVKEKHTLDILFTEILFMLQWFNPFAWLIKDAVKNNLEYKTDHQVTQQFNPQNYQMAMVALADKKGVAPFLTAFNGSQLKNRIIMMKKKTENKYTFIKQLAVLPTLAVLVMGLSAREVKTKIIEPETVKSVEILPEKGALEIDGNKALSNVLDIKKGDASLYIHPSDYVPATHPGFEKIIETNKKKLETRETFYAADNETLIFTMPGSGEEKVATKGKNELNAQVSPDTESRVMKRESSNGASKEHQYPVKGKITDQKKDDSAGIKTKGIGSKGKPLYVVDGEEKDNIEYLNPENIKSISVLKDKSATELYGERAKDGVILIETKAYKPFAPNDKVVIVDGLKFDGNINDIPVNDISSISVLKGEAASPKVYGEKAKNGVVIVNTKTQYNSERADNKPLVIVDGIEYNSSISEIDPDNIETINVLKGESATNLYGEKAKKGAVLITLKKRESKITTPLELRKFIAEKIKYPKEAREKGQQGAVLINVKTDNKTWEVVQAAKSPKQRIDLDEIVVVGYKGTKENKPAEGFEYPALINEVHRVIQLSPEIDIPEFKGKTISIAVKFVLQ